MSAPAPASTASRLIVTRKANTRPVIRTIGKGYISPAEAGGRAICTDSLATSDAPFWSVTRNLMTCGAGVANDALATGAPSSKAPNGPLSWKSHAYFVIRPPSSVEVDLSVIGSPICGSCGDHTNEARGLPARLYKLADACDAPVTAVQIAARPIWAVRALPLLIRCEYPSAPGSNQPRCRGETAIGRRHVTSRDARRATPRSARLTRSHQSRTLDPRRRGEVNAPSSRARTYPPR
jgi:hypothetical protein